jgi:hypothetical protein
VKLPLALIAAGVTLYLFVAWRFIHRKPEPDPWREPFGDC